MPPGYNSNIRTKFQCPGALDNSVQAFNVASGQRVWTYFVSELSFPSSLANLLQLPGTVPDIGDRAGGASEASAGCLPDP